MKQTGTWPSRSRQTLSWSFVVGLTLLLLAACDAQPQSAAVVPAVEKAQVVLDANALPSDTPTLVPPTSTPTAEPSSTPTETPAPTATPRPNPLSIEVMRQQSYPGSELVIEQTIAAGSNYNRYIVSYQSDELKIYALLTVPRGTKPAGGWPVIIFNHGYIPPAEYRTTERYVAYVDAFAHSGYIVLKSDYRGHGSSEGTASGAYNSPAYTDDVLNAVASIKRYKDADPNRIGMWGHSMGGQLTLRAMVVTKDIKAGVIWAGVVAPYPNKFTGGRLFRASFSAPGTDGGGNGGPFGLFGQFRQAPNPQLWSAVSPNRYLADISGPVQLQQSRTDATVPYDYSVTLNDELKQAGKSVEFYTYEGDDHNLSQHLYVALQRSVDFFDRYVKGEL